MCEPCAAEVSKRGEVTFLLLTGELDTATVRTLERRLLEAERRGGEPLIVDLRRLTFIDSTA